MKATSGDRAATIGAMTPPSLWPIRPIAFGLTSLRALRKATPARTSPAKSSLVAAAVLPVAHGLGGRLVQLAVVGGPDRFDRYAERILVPLDLVDLQAAGPLVGAVERRAEGAPLEPRDVEDQAQLRGAGLERPLPD